MAHVALVGNPNAGKSTLFNRLTGLRQRTGNFPGVTVERRSGLLKLETAQVEVTDLPGTYSLHPGSLDEWVVLDALLGFGNHRQPDAVVYVADCNRLDKHTLLLTQVIDLGVPVVLALNFTDDLTEGVAEIDTETLSAKLGVPVVAISARTGRGIERLGRAIEVALDGGLLPQNSFYELSSLETEAAELHSAAGGTRYARLLRAHHHTESSTPPDPEFDSLRLQVRETMQRYERFLPVLRASEACGPEPDPLSERIDAVVTHPVFGPLVFFAVLFVVFQAIFSWASVPQDLIERSFSTVGSWLRAAVPSGILADFLVDGMLAGLGGVAVFVPQIAILFFLLTLLEEVGYMARAVYLFDRLMQRFGLNGRSLVALTSSGACAIPAIMSARTIANPKERLITILVSPLISCSARIPVYAILIGFAVPPITVWGLFNAQGLAFTGVYLLSIFSALAAALVFKYILKSSERSYLMIELPAYRVPVWRNVLTTVWIKTRSFLFGAGRIILAISMVLWVLASFGPGGQPERASEAARSEAREQGLSAEATADLVANARLESSYAGHVGHFIEPAIRPLGYDWRIGIALVTSFAAREVFVGTVATLYAIGSAEDEGLITERMADAKRADGTPVYTVATAVSLILFYLFAMQCMSTLAVTRRETGTWRWPVVQVVYMTALAYGAAFAAYQLLR